MDDDILVDMLRADQTWSLREIYERYNSVLYRLARGILTDEQSTTHTVRDVFVNLWRERRTSEIQNLRTYLTTAVQFLALTQLRDGKLRDHHLKLVHDIEFVTQTEDAINIEALDTSLRLTLNELTPRCRTIFELSRFEHMSHNQIAVKLGITVKLVEENIAEALRVIRKRMDKSMFVIFAGIISYAV